MPIQDNNSVEKLIDELTVSVDAAIGIIGIRCPSTEVFRVLDAIYTLAVMQEVDFRAWMISTGWGFWEKTSPEDLRTNSSVFDPMEPKDKDKATNNIAAAFMALASDDKDRYPEEGYYVMLDAHFYFEEPGFQASVRNQAQRALSTFQRLFIIIPDHVALPDGIAQLIHVIDYSIPGHEELEASFKDLIDQINENRPTYTDEEIEEILTNATGMTKTAFDSAVSLAITEFRNNNEDAKGPDAEAVLKKVRDYKTMALRKTNVLELVNPIDADRVGGLDYLKEWLMNRKGSFTEAAIEFGITPSRGCLLVGLPGSGKSLIAKVTGDILGLPVIRFDVGRVFNSYVGQSEQAMRSVLRMIDDMSPCVLFADEIDKGFAGMGGGSHDSGTTSRVFGTFLTWMQERDQKNRPVFLILTANRVEGLPPELMRRGRVDEIWALNRPNAIEREEIARIHIHMRGHKLNKTDMQTLVERTEDLVGAEIESLIEGALNIDFSMDNDKLTIESLLKERETLKPQAYAFADQVKAIEGWAERNARPASKYIEAASTKSTQTKLRPKGRRIRIASKGADA